MNEVTVQLVECPATRLEIINLRGASVNPVDQEPYNAVRTEFFRDIAD